MRINVTSVLVDDQDKALRFYTDVLGFVKKTENTARRSSLADGRFPGGTRGHGTRFSSPTGTPPRSRSSRRSLRTASPSPRSPSMTPGGEFERLRSFGVRFTQEPVDAGSVTIAVFDDTCGNLIQIASQK